MPYGVDMALAEPEAEPWVPRDTFGARLALIRQWLGGWNVKKTAELCEIDDQSWRNWESKPDATPRDYEGVCRKIAEHTGCDLTWLKAGGPTRSRCCCISPQVVTGSTACAECGGLLVRVLPGARFPELPFPTERAPLAAVQ